MTLHGVSPVQGRSLTATSAPALLWLTHAATCTPLAVMRDAFQACDHPLLLYQNPRFDNIIALAFQKPTLELWQEKNFPGKMVHASMGT